MTPREKAKELYDKFQHRKTEQPFYQTRVSCWACRYCDKESVLKGDKWVLTRTGYCLAEKSTVNGENDFYKKVYVNTTYNECSQFESCT